MQVLSIVSACTRLNRLCISNLAGVQLDWLELLPSALPSSPNLNAPANTVATDLRTLVLCDDQLKDNILPSSPLLLENLSICNSNTEPGVLADFLSPAILPHLRALALFTDLSFLRIPNQLHALIAGLDVFASASPEEVH